MLRLRNIGEGTTYLGPRLVCAVQGTLPNGATDGATPEAWPYKTRMDAGSAPDWEVMIEHVNPGGLPPGPGAWVRLPERCNSHQRRI